MKPTGRLPKRRDGMQRHSAEWRLMVLNEVEATGNIAEVCRSFRLSRPTFYKFKRRCEGRPREQWLGLLVDKKRKSGAHPHRTDFRTRARIIKLALQHPAWGCNKISVALRQKRIDRSHNTVQKILNSEPVVLPTVQPDDTVAFTYGTREGRWLTLDQPNPKLSDEQIKFVADFNPGILEQGKRADAPGRVLIVDCVATAALPGCKSLFLHLAIDSHSSFVFASLRKAKSAADAVWLIENRVRPQLKNCRNSRCLITSRNKVFRGSYASSVEELGFEHRAKARNRCGRGFIERFMLTACKTFFSRDARDEPAETLKETRVHLKTWLAAYNKAPLHGFPNYGKSPSSMFGAACTAKASRNG